MEAPAVTRHRRPFLAPLWLTMLAGLLVAVLVFVVYRASGTTLVVLVHAAEKDPGTIADPPISPEGEARAQRLAHLFGDSHPGTGLDAIYVSEDRRAQQTIAPLIDRLHLTAQTFSPEAAAGIIRAAVRAHSGGAVLVIAGGPAYVKLAEAVGVQATATDEPDVMYLATVPTFGQIRLVRLRL
ncbi:MAG: histidine phosphatase family protein [Proteobacteria bacterium]|nr:histidine phosphatase family protein [Pseudomonadota bacterium]